MLQSYVPYLSSSNYFCSNQVLTPGHPMLHQVPSWIYTMKPNDGLQPTQITLSNADITEPNETFIKNHDIGSAKQLNQFFGIKQQQQQQNTSVCSFPSNGLNLSNFPLRQNNQSAVIMTREEALVSLSERTSYPIMQENGQRRYGPPPDWLGPQPPRGCEVFIGKIPRDCFEDELVPIFELVGRIYMFRLMMDFSGCNRGYGFCIYTNREDTRRAVTELDNYEIRRGKLLGVCFSVDNCRLFVGGIPKTKTKEEIMIEMLKVTEGVNDVIVYPSVADKTKNRGFAFVEYENHKAAAMARRKLIPGRIHLWGHQIAVDWAEPEREVDEDIMSKVRILYVRNLMLHTTEEAVRNHFSRAIVSVDAVERVKKIRDYAFVHFRDRTQACIALRHLNGSMLDGSKIEVTLAKPVDKNESIRAMKSQNTAFAVPSTVSNTTDSLSLSLPSATSWSLKDFGKPVNMNIFGLPLPESTINFPLSDCVQSIENPPYQQLVCQPPTSNILSFSQKPTEGDWWKPSMLTSTAIPVVPSQNFNISTMVNALTPINPDAVIVRNRFPAYRAPPENTMPKMTIVDSVNLPTTVRGNNLQQSLTVCAANILRDIFDKDVMNDPMKLLNVLCLHQGFGPPKLITQSHETWNPTGRRMSTTFTVQLLISGFHRQFISPKPLPSASEAVNEAITTTLEWILGSINLPTASSIIRTKLEPTALPVQYQQNTTKSTVIQSPLCHTHGLSVDDSQDNQPHLTKVDAVDNQSNIVHPVTSFENPSIKMFEPSYMFSKASMQFSKSNGCVENWCAPTFGGKFFGKAPNDVPQHCSYNKDSSSTPTEERRPNVSVNVARTLELLNHTPSTNQDQTSKFLLMNYPPEFSTASSHDLLNVTDNVTTGLALGKLDNSCIDHISSEDSTQNFPVAPQSDVSMKMPNPIGNNNDNFHGIFNPPFVSYNFDHDDVVKSGMMEYSQLTSTSNCRIFVGAASKLPSRGAVFPSTNPINSLVTPPFRYTQSAKIMKNENFDISNYKLNTSCESEMHHPVVIGNQSSGECAASINGLC